MAQNDSPFQIHNNELNPEVNIDKKEKESNDKNENNNENLKKIQSSTNEIVISIDLEKNTINQEGLINEKDQINPKDQIKKKLSNNIDKPNENDPNDNKEKFKESFEETHLNEEIKKETQSLLNENQSMNIQSNNNEKNNNINDVKLNSNDDGFDEFQDFEDIKPDTNQKKVEPEIKKENEMSISIFDLKEEEFLAEVKNKMKESLDSFCKDNQLNSKNNINNIESPEAGAETNMLSDHSVNLFKCSEKPIIEIKSENILTLQQFKEIVENFSKQKQLLSSLQLNQQQYKREPEFSPINPKLDLNPLIEQYTNLQKLINNMSKNILILSPQKMSNGNNVKEENSPFSEIIKKDSSNAVECKNDISQDLKDLNLEKEIYMNKNIKTENIPRPSTLEKTFEKMGYKFVEGGKKDVSKVEVVVEKFENDELNEIINKFPNLLFLLENTLLIQNDIFDEAIKINY